MDMELTANKYLNLTDTTKIKLTVECTDEDLCNHDYDLYGEFINLENMFRFIAENIKTIENALKCGGYDMTIYFEDEQYSISYNNDADLSVGINVKNFLTDSCIKYLNLLKDIEKRIRKAIW